MLKNSLLKFYNFYINCRNNIKKAEARRRYPSLSKPKILNTSDTIRYILENKVSVSRFGDGEFTIVTGGGIAFQQKNERLTKKLQEILKSNRSNHVTCLPYPQIDSSSLIYKAQLYWNNYFTHNYYSYHQYLDKTKMYYDTQVTRLYIDLVDKKVSKQYFDKLKLLWRDKNIVFIEGCDSRLGIGNDLFNNALSVKRILAKSQNAFDNYDEILNFVNLNIEKQSLILIALGPTATALAWDLSKLGFWAIDIGHVDIEYEWMLMGATEKVPVKGKFVGDIMALEKDMDQSSKIYQESIIKRFT